MRRLIGAKNSDNTQAEKEFRSQNNQWDFLVVTQVYLDETLTNICKICESLHISKEKPRKCKNLADSIVIFANSKT